MRWFTTSSPSLPSILPASLPTLPNPHCPALIPKEIAEWDPEHIDNIACFTRLYLGVKLVRDKSLTA